ncbi:hypothetical protein DL765_011579 [Monosporascus sp. GIB2]|nr:hypothetical protein DL765_011579 [Monosporascus sp. GIB2]
MLAGRNRFRKVAVIPVSHAYRKETCPRGFEDVPKPVVPLTLAELVDRAKDGAFVYFQNHPEFQLKRFVGNGAFGIGIHVIEKAEGRFQRQLGVKRALNAESEPDLRNEIQWLKTLRGATHIMQLVSYCDNPT